MIKPFNLGNVPFYWRVKKTLKQPPNKFPKRLPFEFSFLNEIQLIIQKRNPVVLQWLNRVYKENANVGYLQDGHDLAESYGGEFIKFFKKAGALLPKAPSSAADIGCGGVYLLQKIRDLGLSVKGIDPSPVTAEAAKKKGIKIIPEFYPSQSFKDRFDILFHYDVLEHVEDPVGFLRAHHNNLSTRGAVIFAVPDCSHHIASGDISMLLHEHLNYFDQESLVQVVQSAGFQILLLEVAKNGGVLFCCAVPGKTYLRSKKSIKTYSKFLKFRAKAKTAIKNFKRYACQTKNDDLGLYVPIRALPYLSQTSTANKIRFFDDDSGMRGCYFDGFDFKIENLEDLAARPPVNLLICSVAFGDKIEKKIRKVKNIKTKITKWALLLKR